MDHNPLLIAEPTAAKPAPPLPRDPELPRLSEVLDGETMGEWLRQAGAREAEEARPRYVRYKPGNKAIVLYDVRLSGRWTQAVITVASKRNLAKLLHNPDVTALIAQVRDRTPASAPAMFLEMPHALVEWFPLNHLIPGLAFHPHQLGERLTAAGKDTGPSTEPELLTYKPERRAVARWGDLVLKAYARSEDFDQAVEGFAAAAGIPGLPVPAEVDSIRQARLTLQTVVAGQRPPDDRRVDLGQAMALVHGSANRSPYRVTAGDHLAIAGQTCRHLAFLLPAMQADLERLMVRLESELPDSGRPVLSHGDFHHDQSLVDSGQLALIDFDHACMSDPALDPATFAAHLVDGSDTSVQSALAALDELLLGYGHRPVGLDWFLAGAILRRAALPFRTLASDWPSRVAGMIRASIGMASKDHRRSGR